MLQAGEVGSQKRNVIFPLTEVRKSKRNSDGNKTQGMCMFCSKQFNKKSDHLRMCLRDG